MSSSCSLIHPVNVSRSPVKVESPSNNDRLIFDANFDSGNLFRAKRISETEYDLYIREDVNNDKQRVWFYFSVENALSIENVTFHVVNFSKVRLLYKRGLSPVHKSKSQPEWRRMPKHCVKYRRSNRHNGSRILTFKCSFPDARDLHHFAFNYPFTYSDLNDHLMKIQNLNFMHFCRTCIGFTVKQKSIDLLTITDLSNCHDFRNTKTICLTARVHPGESPASYVCQGFLDFVTNELDQTASELRKKYAFQVIPMLNPDGVDLGNHRSNFLGFDLNRQWSNPDPNIHPTIFAAKRAFTKLAENTGRVEIFIDIHAHCQQLNSFLYANYVPEECNNKKQMILPILLSQFTEDYSLDQSRFSSDPTKEGTARRALQELFGAQSLCYTLEVSVLGYEAKTKNRSVIFYDRDSYRRIGKNLALAIYRYSLLTPADVEKLLENYSLVAGNSDAFREECRDSIFVLKQKNAREKISDESDN